MCVKISSLAMRPVSVEGICSDFAPKKLSTIPNKLGCPKRLPAHGFLYKRIDGHLPVNPAVYSFLRVFIFSIVRVMTVSLLSTTVKKNS